MGVDSNDNNRVSKNLYDSEVFEESPYIEPESTKKRDNGRFFPHSKFGIEIDSVPLEKKLYKANLIRKNLGFESRKITNKIGGMIISSSKTETDNTQKLAEMKTNIFRCFIMLSEWEDIMQGKHQVMISNVKESNYDRKSSVFVTDNDGARDV